MQTWPYLLPPSCSPSAPSPMHTCSLPHQESSDVSGQLVSWTCCVTLSKTFALSGLQKKMTLKVPTYRTHELLRGLSVSNEVGQESVPWMSLKEPLPSPLSQFPYL